MNLNPRVPKITDEDIAQFGEVLPYIIPDKIEELLVIMDEAEKERDSWSVTVTQARAQGKLDNFGLWFWLLWGEHRFTRYDKAQKWLQYWLDLYEKTPDPIPVSRPVVEYRNEIDIEKIKRERLIEDYYTEQLRPNANRLVGKCPFHEERTGSFFIFTDDNHFHCFSCGEHGDVITFIEKTKNMDFKQAIDFLK